MKWFRIRARSKRLFANKAPSSQGYGFSSGHVWMWELDHKVSKNWCFWTVVLEKNLERLTSSLESWNVKPVKVVVAQSCPTLCNPMDYSPPGSSVHGIFQARILEWVAIFFSSGSSRPRNQTYISCIAGGFYLSSREAQCPWSGFI